PRGSSPRFSCRWRSMGVIGPRQVVDEDLVAERWRPCGPPREPRAKRPLAACRQAKDAPKPRTDTLVTPRHQAAPLEIMEELIDLPDVRMPEGPEPLIEQLE